ncbi:MAG: asparaginase [Acidobacteriota bacterium]|nr:asparaginase [Acidobacteriota bacterium]MDH3528741.1 asparaginase [Acidobacteriota bacterium]
MSCVLANVYRNGTLESIHRGSLVVLDGNGDFVASAGDPDTVTFWRSAAKAFQAIPFVTSGAAAAFGYSDKALALACASHSGEDFHTQLVAEMLESAGFTESDLQCGAHPPFHEETAADLIRHGAEPTQLHNNCSGKHAAMLALAKHTGSDPDTYLIPGDPLQGMILETVSVFTEVPAGEIKMGTDGCSAPNFAISLRAMARAYAKLINPPSDFDPNLEAACRRIVSAKMKFPEYVGGSVRLDSKVMRAMPGRIVCKVGAEGVWSIGVLPGEKWPAGLAVALKIEDGDDYRARPAVGIELLRKLGVVTDDAEKVLGEHSPQKLVNRKDIEVGEVAAEFELEYR